MGALRWRGIMAQDCPVGRTVVDGAIDQPLAAPVIAVQARTVRLEMTGTATSGTLLLPPVIYHTTPNS